ncbi:MAG: hypothetical protein HPY50_02375 [Firmicutes bacterium]|nr:hypothetical protein [Bacillota bacterium]
MLKKLFLVLMCCLMVISFNAGIANAAGIPVFQFSATSLGSGSLYIRYNDYEWSAYVPPPDQEGIGYTYYYKILYTMPETYLNTGYYIAAYSIYSSGDGSTTTTYTGVLIQGRDSATGAWRNIQSYSFGRNGNTTLTKTLTTTEMCKQLRIVGYVDGVNNVYGRVTGTLNSIDVSLLSADQDTVQEAKNAALNAYEACYDSVADKTVVDYVKEIRQSVQPDVEINKVQGLGGATCTSSTSYTLVVSVSPSTGATLTATCSGPSSPSISISGNRVTFNGLSAQGAYTANIVATFGSTSTQYSNVFFKV